MDPEKINHSNVQGNNGISLQNNEELFRLIFDQSPIGSVIANVNYDPLRVNNAFSQMIGYSKEELLSMKFPEYTHPDDLDKEFKNLELLN